MSGSVGIHIDSSNIDTFVKRVKTVYCAGYHVVQIMSSSIKESNIDKIKSIIKKLNMSLVVHLSYTINIASDWDKYSSHVQRFIFEIEQAHKVGAYGVVIHLGKKKDLSLEEAYNNMLTLLLYICQTEKQNDIKIFLETTAGQGSETCSKLEDLAYFYRKIPKLLKNRIKICLDTCHIFSAGYDIRTKENISLILESIEELIGLQYIGLVHLNDSAVDMGSNVDRHAPPNYGHIGAHSLKMISHFFRKMGINTIVETSSEDIQNDLRLVS